MSARLALRWPRVALATARLTATSSEVVGPAWPDRQVKRKVFAMSLALNLLGIALLSFWQIGNADALSRTANAWYVLFSRDPHLGAIGFVWPILPSVVQLPLLPLARLLGHPELAGLTMSVVSSAGTLVVLSAILGGFGVVGWTRLLWLLLIQVHPQFWYLSTAGLAEVPFLFFLSLAILSLMRVSRTSLALVGIGGSLAAGFYVRYESIGYLAGFALALLILERWAPPRAGAPLEGRLLIRPWTLGSRLVQWWPRGQAWEQLEGRMLAVVSPPLYAILIWIIANWMIMGDPLYFQRSVFSLAAAPDVARNLGPSHPLYTTMGSLPLTVGYALLRIVQVNATLLAVGALALVLGIHKRDRLLLGLCAMVGVAITFTGFQVFSGTLPPFLRYWNSITLFAVVLGAACVQAYPLLSGRWNRAVPAVITALLVLSNGITAISMSDPSAAFDERRLGARFRNDLETDRALTAVDFWWFRGHDARLIGPILDQVSTHGLTLIDVETGYPSILAADHPERLAISPDRDFRDLLAYPEVHLSYIAVTDPRLGGARDLVNTQFPGFFEHGAPWARLLGEVEGTIQPWRIYEIAPDPNNPPTTFEHQLPAGLRQVVAQPPTDQPVVSLPAR